MREITIEIDSNEEIWRYIDEKLNHIYISNFRPKSSFSWWKTDLKISESQTFENISVRNMSLDLQVDLTTLRKLIELNTQSLIIYQFDKPIPDTLLVAELMEQSKENILFQNGLKHSFFINFEFLTVKSFDENFIEDLQKNKR
ncbi:hypothetical protein [Bernardetia sp.]|uniref:hypothetical protein n=1 Tax=Bernardetia sp. TaxID=1937974 RepID=UPI0025BFB187|nr:hypothetical protein [Bernardetia sp.]